MSRTDKTRPWWIKGREHPVERHDHRNGVCDLEADPSKFGYRTGECYADCQWWRPEFRCCCKQCDWPTEDRRRRRYDGRRQARDWRKEYE